MDGWQAAAGTISQLLAGVALAVSAGVFSVIEETLNKEV